MIQTTQPEERTSSLCLSKQKALCVVSNGVASSERLTQDGRKAKAVPRQKGRKKRKFVKARVKVWDVKKER